MESKKLTMKDIPASERPYEILEHKGAAVLTDAQLLSVILSSGTREETALELSQRLLSSADGEGSPLKNLFSSSYLFLASQKGIGRVKALKILGIAEICKRLSSSVKGEAVYLNVPSEVASYCSRYMESLNQEIVIALYLNVKNRLIFEKEISRGSISRSLLSPREVFEPAIARGASRIILVHNHPSGDPEPSTQDLSLTEKLCVCGDFMEIPLIDHVIVGSQCFFSMKEHNKL